MTELEKLLRKSVHPWPCLDCKFKSIPHCEIPSRCNNTASEHYSRLCNEVSTCSHMVWK